MKVIITGGRRSTYICMVHGIYWPKANKITVYVGAIRSDYVCWRRMVIAVYIHELVHMADWLFFTRRDMKRWVAMPPERAEYWAYWAQGAVCKLLFTGVAIKVIRDIAGGE